MTTAKNFDWFEQCPADTFLLAAFGSRRLRDSNSPVIDLGCGPGRLLYELWKADIRAPLVGLERDLNLIEVAARELKKRNAPVMMLEKIDRGVLVPGKVTLVPGDLRFIEDCCDAGLFSAVLLNPPFFRQNEGRLPPNPNRASFRHQIFGTLRDFLSAAEYAASPSGKCFAVYPPDRAREFRETAEQTGWFLDTVQQVQPSEFSEPRWTLFSLNLEGCSETETAEPITDPDRYMGYEE